LHCLMPINYSAQESWPRIGLEAMAAGVPIVAPREGGWCDLIVSGENGFLAGSAEEFGELGTRLARDEQLRLQIAAQARRKLEEDLANPELIWAGWQRLFASLGGRVTRSRCCQTGPS
jgi:glycosyltransferase involved in cell wall biosynthesis